MNEIKNPCIDVCQYDGNEICTGCRRTLKEARNWWRFSDAEKLKVLRNIKNREAEGSGNFDHYV